MQHNDNSISMVFVFFITEQQYFDIEKQLITSNGKLEAETTKKNSIQEKFQDIGNVKNITEIDH